MKIAIVKWFDTVKGFGFIGTPEEEEFFLPINSFLAKPDNISKGQAVVFSIKLESNRNRHSAKKCRLVGEPEDWKTIFSYLGKSDLIRLEDKAINHSFHQQEIKPVSLIALSTKQFIEGKSETEIISIITDYYDTDLDVKHFIEYCEQIENCITNCFQKDVSANILNDVYEHFHTSLKEEILFDIWKQMRFKYIAYNDKDDYEIPERILLSNISNINKPELERIMGYSYGEQFYSQYITQKLEHTETLSSDDVKKLYFLIDYETDDKKEETKTQINNIYAEKISEELIQEAKNLGHISNNNDLENYNMIIRKIPNQIDEKTNNYIIETIQNLIISKHTEDYKPELWVKGLIDDVPFESVSKYFLNEDTTKQNQLIVLSKLELNEQFQLIRSYSKGNGFEAAYELLEDFLRNENGLNSFFKISDCLFDSEFWIDKKGKALYDMFHNYTNAETNDKEKYELFFMGYIKNIPEKIVFENISQLSKNECYRIFSSDKKKSKFIYTILEEKFSIENISCLNWLYDLAIEFLDSDSFYLFDNKVFETIQQEDYFNFWKDGKAKIFPKSYIGEILAEKLDNYSQIQGWIDSNATTNEEIWDFLLSYLSKNEAVTDRRIFHKQLNYIKYLVDCNEFFLERIKLIKNNFYSVILWYLEKEPVFDFDLLKSKFIYFAPEEQVRIIRRLFLLKASGEFDITIDKLNELTRFDIDLYKTNLDFNPDIPTDITTDVIIQALSTFREKGRFMIENELFNVVLEDLQNDKTKRFKLSNYFEECEGRYAAVHNWRTQGEIKRFKKLNPQGNLMEYFAISFSWEKLGWDTFEEIKEEVKKLHGRKWNEEDKHWGIPLKYEDIVLEFAKKHMFFLDFEGNNYNNNLHLVEFKREGRPKGISFCEGRLANKPDKRFNKEFWWCAGKQCFEKCESIHSLEGWESYTLLDFCEILGFNTDETNKMGDYIPKGHYYQFIALINRFNRLLKKLYCDDCNHILYPSDFGAAHFAAHTIVRFQCRNENCDNNNEIYLNHCLNGQCNDIVDSRISKKCDNGWYICETCGSCCSHEVFKRKLSNLELNGGTIPLDLIECVDEKRGHLERAVYFCYKCKSQMIEKSEDVFLCVDCKVSYDTTSYNHNRPHKHLNNSSEIDNSSEENYFDM